MSASEKLQWEAGDHHRLAVVYIPESAVFALFFSIRVGRDQVNVPVLRLPPDASVRSVFFDPSRRSFGFVIHSLSFAEHAPALSLPEIRFDYTRVLLAREKETAPPAGGKN